MKLIYVAGKFRGPNSWAIENNIRRAEEVALEVWRAGAAALCPHLNTRFFQGALPDSVWLDGDLEMLARCDAVLMVPGWMESEGARAEHEFARLRKIPVLFDLAELRLMLDCGETEVFIHQSNP